MLTIIPARGGSKGLPGKNIKLLNGKPLIAYTIEAAQQAVSVTDLVVSTDSEEIAMIAAQYGARCPFLRPDYLATDNALAIDNYIYTINKLEEDRNSTIENFIVLQPTSPLRISEDIDNAVNIFSLKDADSVISYTEEQHPVIWHKYLTEDNKFIDLFPSNLNNRQEFKKTYYPNGSIYIFKTELIRTKRYYSENSFAYVMPRQRSVDIDTLEDFKLAEFYLTN